MKELVSNDDATTEVETLNAGRLAYVALSPCAPTKADLDVTYREQPSADKASDRDLGGERIDALEARLSRLERTVDDYKRKLDAKNSAIGALMDELAHRNDGPGTLHIDDSTILESAPVADNVSARQQSGPRITRLFVGHFSDRELRFPLFKNRLTIGRTRDNDIHLDAGCISRRHAVVVTDGGLTRIVDWGSKNGVYVNSVRITEHFLCSGDRIRIGPVEFRYEELSRRDVF